MKHYFARPLFIVSAMLVAGLALATAQNVNPMTANPADNTVSNGWSSSLAGHLSVAETVGTARDDENKIPQAIGAAAAPQLTPCPEPAKIFPLRDYTGPLKGVVNPSSGNPVVQRGLDGRPCGLNPAEKFNLFAKTAVNFKTYLSAGYNAGIAQAQNNDPEWGQGAEGYGQRYAAALGDQMTRNFFRKFAYPVIFHQDPRYFRSEGSAGHRLGHALAHTVVTKSDDGNSMINYSQLLGTASAVALGNLYHPGHHRGFTSGAKRFGISIGTDMGLDIVREFWPEMVRTFHLPFRAR